MADTKDLKEPKDLAEFWMRSFRIRLDLLSAVLSASQSSRGCEGIQRIANLAPRLGLAGSDLAADY